MNSVREKKLVKDVNGSVLYPFSRLVGGFGFYPMHSVVRVAVDAMKRQRRFDARF
jgi:hypothetical protein